MHEVDRQVIEKVKEIQVQASQQGKIYPPIARIADSKKLRILVTGGAGFVVINVFFCVCLDTLSNLLHCRGPI